MKLLVKLLSIPLDTLSIAVLRMHHYPTLMDYMKFQNKRTVALRICKAVIKDNKHLTSSRTVEQLLDFIRPLLVDDEQGGKEEPYEFEEGQESVARILHMVSHRTSNDVYFDLLMKFKKIFVKGGIKRQKHTYPALVFALIRLTWIINDREVNPDQPQYALQEESKDDQGEEEEEEPVPSVKVTQKKIFMIITELISALQSDYPELALRLNLQAVQAVNNIRSVSELEDLAYEFMSQAFIIFEEEITETEVKVASLNLIVCTLHNLTCFGAENFDTLIANAIGYSGKLLKKNLQAEAITISSHLFFCPAKKQGNKVMDQLKKALKTSEVCMTKPENLYLLVKILNTYLHFYQCAEV
jgi:vacuolar protein sorting-associated protein 35